MNIQLAEEIKDMLYENGSVVIPGLGGFKGSYKVAAIDSVQGHLAPPSLDIAFDPNVIINDGVFLDFLKKKHQISTQEAQKILDNFMDFTEKTFEKHEIVVIPEVGRLYRDFNQKIQFLPNTTNFNTDTFGLPVAQFSPITRTTVERTAAAEAVFSQNEPPPPPPVKPFPEPTTDIPFPTVPVDAYKEPSLLNQWRRFIPALTVAVLCILTFSIYMHNQNKEKTATRHTPMPTPKANTPLPPPADPETHNVIEQPPVASTPSVKKPEKTITHEEMVQPTEKKQETNTASETPSAAGSNQARVFLGGFGDKNNIARHKKWLADNNYSIFEKPSGNILLLYADVTYSDKQDLRKIVNKLGGRFGAEAVKVEKR